MRKGDTVLILAGPYERWYREEVANRPCRITGKYRNYSSSDQKWIDTYNPFNLALYDPWTVKFIDSSAMVQIGNFIVPVAVLAVLEAA